MKIQYLGKSDRFERCAVISYDEDNKKEEELNDRIVDFLEKMTSYKISCEMGCTIIAVDNMADYKDLVVEYKKAKKTFTACMKYGF